MEYEEMDKSLINILILLAFVLSVTSCKNNILNNPSNLDAYLEPPTDLTITFSADTAVVVKWKHSNSGSYSFLLEISTNAQEWEILGRAERTYTYTAMYNFKTGIFYYFRIATVSDKNQSSYVTIQKQVPAIGSPANLTVDFLDDTKAVLNWIDNSLYETSFEILRSTDRLNFTVVKTLSANVTTAEVEGIYLTSETYYFKVRAKTNNNESGYSNIAEGRPGRINEPTDLSVLFPDDTKAVLNWVDNSAYEISFEIEKSIDGNNFVLVKIVPTNTTSTEVEGIYIVSEKYYFRVKARTENNQSGYSNIAEGSPAILNGPTNLTALFKDNNNVVLSWNDNSSWELGFEIEMSTDGLFYTVVKTVPANTINTVISNNYSYFTYYHFKVRAKSNYNFSSYSNIVQIGLKPLSPGLNSPLNGALNVQLDPTLKWESSISAESYTLQVSTDYSFTNLIFNQNGLTNTSYYIEGLTGTTQYFWRVAATNIFGSSTWSSVYNFTTIFFCGSSTVTYAGKTYNTVMVGVQCWLKENLDVGVMIDSMSNQTNNGVIEKYCYNNNTANCEIYGGLYQWNEAMQYSTTLGTRGICPPGWHIPTFLDFYDLANTVENNGNALKSIGVGAGNGAGTNTSGFSALLAGSRNYNGHFISLSYSTYFWISSEYGAPYANLMGLSRIGNSIYFGSGTKNIGFSIRCAQD